MAFVYRSSKNLIEPIKSQYNPSPLIDIDIENIPEITKKYFSKDNIIRLTAPFGVNASKELITNKDNSNIPGPGSYQLQENFLKKSFNPNLTSPFDPESIEGGPSQLFISKDRRFKCNKTTDNENPSPADYFIEKNKFEKNLEKKIHSQYPKPKIYKVFDPNRKISIPSDDFFFEINTKGEVEVRQDINEIKNKGNNTGPGSYNLRYNTKNSKSIDWSKTADNIKKEKNKNKGNERIIDLDKLKIDTQVNTFNKCINTFDNTYNTGTNRSTNGLNMNVEKMANKMCYTDLNNDIEEKTRQKNKLEIKVEELPGPGDYEISPYINVPICFSNVTNFGSNSSRGLLYPKRSNKLLIGHRDKKFLAIIKNNNKKKEHNKSSSFDNQIDESDIKSNKKRNIFKNRYNENKINELYLNNLKERNLINKKILMDQIGPGSYDPSFSFYKNRKDSDVQNFGALEKRFKEKNEKFNNPGVGTYSFQSDFDKKKSMFISQVPPNISQKHSEGISNSKVQDMKMYLYLVKHKHPGAGEYSPEIVNSLNFKVYKNSKNSDKKPGFIYSEKRFFEPKSKYEDNNQIGKYNIGYREKEFIQQISPFGSKEIRYKYENENGKPKEIGPGAYRYDSYFDWNKKSYNMIFNN